MKSSTCLTGLGKPEEQAPGPVQGPGNRYHDEGREVMYVLR
jgi:hypothetical protein